MADSGLQLASQRCEQGGHLANYSGGTAPDSHRISFSARRAQRIDRATNGPPAGVYGSVVNNFRLAAFSDGVKPRTDLTRTQFLWNRHCEQSAAISLGQGTLLRERDRRVALLIAMTKWVWVSWADRTGPLQSPPVVPAFAGTRNGAIHNGLWIPDIAGMTVGDSQQSYDPDSRNSRATMDSSQWHPPEAGCRSPMDGLGAAPGFEIVFLLLVLFPGYETVW